jgi:putative transposase
MGRPLRIIQTEYPYHLVCRTNNRTFRFHRKKTIRIFAKVLTQVTEKYGLKIHHFILMSNHYHIVATATEENLHRAMQYLNSRTAFRFNRTVNRTGHLWGDRYKSCIISTDEYYLACVRYIYRNPIRAKMVEDLEQFEDSSLQFWAFGRKVKLALSDDHLVILWGKNKEKIQSYFRILVMDEGIGIPSEKLTRVGLKGLFFGSVDFVQQMSRAYLDC